MQPSNQDAEHLRLLVIFHYIWGAIQAAGGLFGLAFVAMGIFLATSPQIAEARNAPPPWFGTIFAGVGAFVMFSFEAMAALTFLTARFLARCQHHIFCVVISAINCLSVPFGTALGIFTILVLLRPSVKQAFLAPPARSS